MNSARPVLTSCARMRGRQRPERGESVGTQTKAKDLKKRKEVSTSAKKPRDGRRRAEQEATHSK